MALLILFLPFMVLTADFLGPFFLLQKSFILGDYAAQHWPWAQTVHALERANQLPFWTDAMACGFPLLAEGQAAALYGIQRALNALLPFWAAYTWSVVLHFLAAAAGLFLYARTLRLSRLGAAFAMLVFGFGSAYAGCFYNAGSLRTLAWLPYLLWLVEVLARRPAERMLWGAVGAFLVGQMWLAGFSQLALYALGYAFCAALMNAAARRPGAPAALAWISASAVLGTLLAMPQISLTLELIRESVRSGETASFALWGSMPPTALAGLFFPEWGTLQRVSFYLGIPAVFAAVCFFMLPRARKDFRHAWLFLLFVLLALGKYNPLYAAAIQTFSLNFLRNPSKFLYFAALSGAILAGLGWDALWLSLKRPAAGRLLKITAVAAVILAALPALASAAWSASTGLRASWGEKIVQATVAEKGVSGRPRAEYEAMMRDFFERLGSAFSYTDKDTAVAVFWILACGALLAAVSLKKIPRTVFAALFLTVAAADLHVFGWHLATGFIGNAASIANAKPSEAVLALQGAVAQDPGPVAEFARDPAAEILPPNLAMAYALQTPGGYSPLLLKRYYELTRYLGIVDGSTGRAAFSEEVWQQSRGLLDLIGVQHLLTDSKIEWRGFQHTGEAGGHWVYRNANVLPPAAAWGRGRLIEDASERTAYLASGAYDPTAEIVVESGENLPEGSDGYFSTAEIQKKLPWWIRAQFTVPAEGIGWVRIAAYPGWRVHVDGKRVPWFRVNHAFIGFRLPPGGHLVDVFYRPNGWNFWLWTSSLLGLLTAGAAWVGFRRARAAKRPSSARAKKRSLDFRR